MNGRNSGLDISRIRCSVREIDGRVRLIEAEDRLFHRFGFGSEVHDIELTALRSEKRDLLAKLDRAREANGMRPARRPSVRSWLILPAALGAVVLQAFRRRRPRRQTRTAFAD